MAVSSKDAASRQQCLDELDDFISTSQQDLTNVLDMFNWTPEHFMQPRNQSVCPYSSDHRMSPASLIKHAPVCELTSQDLSIADAMKVLDDSAFFYKEASNVHAVNVDLKLLNSVLWNHHVQNHSVFYGYKSLPRTPEEEESMMKRGDRLALAEYIIQRAKEANRLKELGQDELLVSENLADLIKKDGEERKLDTVEEMAALRDFRRRRQTYRAKNVHITKKSHTEIMREVINNQMEMYAQSVKDEAAPQARNNVETQSTSGQSKTDDTLHATDKPYRDDNTPRDTYTADKRPRDSHRLDDHTREDSRHRSEKRSHSRAEEPSRYKRHKERHRSHSRSRSISKDRESTHKEIKSDTVDHRSRSRDREKHHKDRRRSRSRSQSHKKSKKSKHKKSKHKRSKSSKRSSVEQKNSEEEEEGEI